MTTNSTCNCSALMKEVSDMCRRCKVEYIEWATGINKKELIWLAKGVTVDERVKKLKRAMAERNSLKKHKGLRLVK